MDIPFAVSVLDDQGPVHCAFPGVKGEANVNEHDVLKAENCITVRNRAGFTEVPRRENLSNASRPLRRRLLLGGFCLDTLDSLLKEFRIYLRSIAARVKSDGRSGEKFSIPIDERPRQVAGCALRCIVATGKTICRHFEFWFGRLPSSSTTQQ